MEGFTKISLDAFNQAVYTSYTPAQAKEWLLGSLNFRTLRDKLLRYWRGDAEAMKPFLREGLNALHPDAKERDSIRVSLNNWFADKKGIDDRAISRGYALEMCFILGLAPERANEFMRDVTGEGIHHRNPEEFVAVYALGKGMDYPAYSALCEAALAQMSALPQKAGNAEIYTQIVAEAVQGLHADDELIDHMREHRAEFSSAHNTSFAYFQDMIRVLTEEGTDASVSTLVEDNLYRNIVARKGRKLSAVEKSIRSGWPEEAQFSRMKSREVNVNRKALILLYLASGGGLSTEADWDSDFDDDGDWSADEADQDFEGICTGLDAMLVECGFAPLDPRQPFDWMVLFCMATGDLFELDTRFEAVLGQLFGNDLKA